MRETHASIEAWRAETFGAQQASLARKAARVNEEFAELLRAWTAGKPDAAVLEEMADVAICLAMILPERAWTDALRGQKDAAGLPIGLPSFHDAIRNTVEDMADLVVLALRDDAENAAGYGFFFLRTLADAADLVSVRGPGRLAAAIDDKMTINRQRVWRRDGTGHGYHLRASVPGEAGPRETSPSAREASHG